MFLPVSKQDLIDRNIDQLDFILISGDAYIDHPSFGVSIIGRYLEYHGYTVGIIAQPDIKDKKAFHRLGTPKLAFLVSGGNIDSMVNHYTVSKRRRKTDNYSPNGQAGYRPDYATMTYSRKIRKYFPHIPIIIGGIEASLRRLAHYDYWQNTVRKSILIDSKADLLLYGMAEKTIIQVADYLKSGLDVRDIIFLKGTVFKTNKENYVPDDAIELPSYDKILENKKTFAKSVQIQYKNTDYITSKPLVERYRYHTVVQNPPQEPLSQEEMDEVYRMPFMRDVHPMYQSLGGIPAIREVQFSIIANRGCYGGCSFCALTSHQGRVIQSRSKESIIREAKLIKDHPDFKGYIHDVGGPTANFYDVACKKQTKHGVCMDKECIGKDICPALQVHHDNYLDILRELRKIDKVKKVFIRSGIRYDYALYDTDKTFLKEVIEHHVSGQLKVAPEHVSPRVLHRMNKPAKELYNQFSNFFYDYTKQINKEQYLVPYLMSSHPGSTLDDAIMLACYVRDMGYNPEQVQDFYPTPGTLSTAMYYSGYDPRDMSKVYVPRTNHEKAMQRALIQYRNPRNYKLVKEALIKANRTDLIGYQKHCLIQPR